MITVVTNKMYFCMRHLTPVPLWLVTMYVTGLYIEHVTLWLVTMYVTGLYIEHVTLLVGYNVCYRFVY